MKAEKETLRTPGELIKGRYEVAQMIGKGATGEVYVVADRESGSAEIVLKYMKLGPEYTSAIEHFKSEFDTMTHLNHPHIAKVYDFEWDDDLEFYFFTSELIDGFDFFHSTNKLDIEQIELLFIQSLRALEYLHGHGIFHYDIKPQNILVQDANGPSPSVKVIDFGLASACPHDKIVGTPSYIAPEIIKQKNPDGRADLYSLGVLLYIVLTHKNPFKGASNEETFQNHLNRIPETPASINPSVPEYLSSIIMKLLEKDPANRYATPSEIIHDINFRSPRFYAIETPETLLSYVPWEGPFIGRDNEIKTYLEWIEDASKHKETGTLFWIRGQLGAGKSRFAEECRKIAQLSNFNTFLCSEIDYRFMHKLEKAKEPFVVILDNFDKFLKEADEEKKKYLEDLIRKSNTVITSSDTEEVSAIVKNFFINTDVHLIRAIELGNFNIKELGEYIRTITGLSEAPQRLLGSLLGFTEGNPCFLTETIKEMISKGLLFDSAGRWKKETLEDLGVDFSELEVPKNIYSRLSSYFDNLPFLEKKIAAFISSCHGPVEKEMIEQAFNVENEDPLANLIQKKILIYNSHAQKYSFRNVISKRTVYLTIPQKSRRAYHDQIALYLKNKNAEEKQIRYHLQKGSDDKIARQELVKDIFDDSNKISRINLIDEFLSRFGDTLDDDIFKATLLKAERKIEARNLKDAFVIYNDLLKKVNHDKGKNAWLFKIHIAIASLFKRMRKFNEATTHLKKAKKLAELMENDAAPIIVENHLAGIDRMMGNLDYAIEKYRNSLEKAKKLETSSKENIINNDLGHTYFYKGDYSRAAEILSDDVAFFRKLGDKKRLSRALYSLGETFRHLRKYENAEESFNETIKIAKETRNMERLFRAYNGIGNMLSDRGNFIDSIGYFERALDLAIHLGNHDAAVGIMINTAIINSNLGNIKKSFDTFKTTLSFLEREDFPVTMRDMYLCRVHLELGELYRIEKNFSAASKHLGAALKFAKKPQAKLYLFWILLTEAKLAKDKRDASLAKDYLNKAKKLADSDNKKRLFEEIQKYTSA